MLTEYATTYHPHPLQKEKNFKPADNAQGSGEPLSDKTTNRVDYIKHPLDRPYVHQHEGYKRPPGEFDHLTSYTKDYPMKRSDPAKAVKIEGAKMTQGKFDGEPTYTSDYRKWDLGKPKRYGPEAAWQPPRDKFEGQSTFARDYRPFNEPRREAIRPNEAGRMSDAPFDSTTGYRVDYVRHPMAPKFMKEREKYKPAGVPMDGTTTFMRDFRGQMGERTKSFKPDNQVQGSGEPLDDLTTFKNDYRRWPAERPYHHLPDAYKKPDGDIDLNTTHNLTYKPQPLQPHVAIKPKSAHGDPGAFNGVTNYSTDYRPWEIDRVHPKTRPGYQPNTAPFEGISTHAAHFGPKPLNPTASFRPGHGQVGSDAPFDDATMYRLEYTPKRVGPCPAAILDTGNATYRFIELDPRGHKLYQPVYTSVTELSTGGPTARNALQTSHLEPLAVA
ncbi:hypothetical protein C0Q70_20314 [Pomacea canaliculata]|uniref:Uncharacterized protein n=2 Tax=Pomacea canaliculata TaxID=400727 RepID=A0A2T7NF66_POMCA|nr:hypothetical protein C0Q70_20314 [Pomacea canaliculata]